MKSVTIFLRQNLYVSEIAIGGVVFASLFNCLRFSTSIITRPKFNASAVELSTCQSSKLYDLASAYNLQAPTRLMWLPRSNFLQRLVGCPIF
jgi:hypothetical protein